MKYSVDLETTIDKKAKLLLMGSCCDNCFYHNNPWRIASVFCVRHNSVSFGSNQSDFMDFIVNEGVCSKWVDCKLPKDKKKKVELKLIGKYIRTQADVDELIEILED